MKNIWIYQKREKENKRKMKTWNKIKGWWKNNQKKNSEDYLEKESLRKDLIYLRKILKLFSGSEIANSNGAYLERLILIQNMRIQKKMNLATEGLKTATWILALATTIFAWVAIKNSEHSNEIILTLQGIATIVIYFIFLAIAINLIWNFIKFVFRKIRK